MDFGAAKRQGQTNPHRGHVPSGHYHSPEAWRFGMEHWNEGRTTYRPGKADDQYALGVVLYRLLTRRFPFEVAWDDEASVLSVIHQEPLPPHVVNPHVPPVVGDVCMKLLEKQPEKRHPSVLALGKELTHLLAGADASWEVPLHDGPRVPRRGRRGVTALKKQPEAAAPRVEPTPATPTPVTVAEVPVRAMALRALGRAAVGFAVLVGVALVGWWLAQRWKPELPSVVLSTPSPTLKSLLGQEVAPSGPPPEAGAAAAPPVAKPTPAVVASLVTRPKDDAVKKQQAPTPPGDTKPKGALAPVAKWCAGAAAAAHMACAGPQVRPGPAPEACPAGAAETMKELGIVHPGSSDAWYGEAQMGTDFGPDRFPVREGSTSATLADKWGKLPMRTVLQGRISFRRRSHLRTLHRGPDAQGRHVQGLHTTLHRTEGVRVESGRAAQLALQARSRCPDGAREYAGQGHHFPYQSRAGGRALRVGGPWRWVGRTPDTGHALPEGKVW